MSFNDPFNSNDQVNNDNTTNDFYNYNDEDPAADFLEREKQELGDITGNGDTNSFEDSFSSKNNRISNGVHSPFSNDSGSNAQMSNQRSSPYEGLSPYHEQMNEPEKIQKWREEFSARIQKKDTEEEVKCKDMREQAKKELDDFHKQRVEQLERNKEQNRVNNRALEDEIFSINANNNSGTTSNGKVNDWDKITSLCEFNPKNNRSQKDLTRYRSVLLQLKQQQSNGK